MESNPYELCNARAKTRTPSEALDMVRKILEIHKTPGFGAHRTALEIGKKLGTWNKAGCVLVIIAMSARIHELEKQLAEAEKCIPEEW